MSRKIVIIFAAAAVVVAGAATSARALFLHGATMSHPTAFSHPMAADPPMAINHPPAFHNPAGAGAVQAFPQFAFQRHRHHFFIGPRLAYSDYPVDYAYRLRFIECFRRVWTASGPYWVNVCGYESGY
jgi:hypothetical protein